MTFAAKIRPEIRDRIPALCAQHKLRKGELIEAAVESLEVHGKADV